MMTTKLEASVADPDPHQSNQLDPDPHRSDKLNPDPYPNQHQFADDKPKCMEYLSTFSGVYIWKL
jgi:hypothetical protein